MQRADDDDDGGGGGGGDDDDDDDECDVQLSLGEPFSSSFCFDFISLNETKALLQRH